MRVITISFSFMLLVGIAGLNAQTPTDVPTGPAIRFKIQSAMNYGKNNGGYWDVPGVFQPGTAINRGANIQVWNMDAHHDRYFTFYKTSVDGYYGIQVGLTNETRIDIKGAKGPSTPNGSNVQVWDRNDLTNQQFLLHHLGNGRFKIYDRNSGKALCLAGRKNANGTNVHIWDDHNGPWMEWYLIDTETGRPFVPKSKANFASWISSNNTTVIDNYLKDVSSGQLASDDSGSIRGTMDKLDATAQVNGVVTLMNSVLKNDDKNARNHIYTQLENVNYKKIPFLVKAIMTAHFSKFQEPDANLKNKVNAIQQKMNSGK